MHSLKKANCQPWRECGLLFVYGSTIKQKSKTTYNLFQKFYLHVNCKPLYYWSIISINFAWIIIKSQTFIKPLILSQSFFYTYTYFVSQSLILLQAHILYTFAPYSFFLNGMLYLWQFTVFLLLLSLLLLLLFSPFFLLLMRMSWTDLQMLLLILVSGSLECIYMRPILNQVQNKHKNKKKFPSLFNV